MTFHLKRTLIIFAILMVIMQITKGQDEPPAESEEEDDSSSEETVEDSNEARKRRRRSVETSVEGADVSEVEPAAAAPAFPGIPGLPELPALPPIPGLPDPQTIMQIAEILTSVGQQVLPILVSGNSGVSNLVTNRVQRDRKFLKDFKNEIDSLTENNNGKSKNLQETNILIPLEVPPGHVTLVTPPPWRYCSSVEQRCYQHL
ncbi:hypothetical protein FF38_06976 [Lucilia cuprina]|uniref:DUF4794 domain-containing protein n=1 Tax=Lucilia cuprina TaxID=7375 RepID=A0A0L0CNA0_LUCCU|nr:hypothetical protein FF38_06976 [Lucilia cuprina]